MCIADSLEANFDCETDYSMTGIFVAYQLHFLRKRNQGLNTTR